LNIYQLFDAEQAQVMLDATDAMQWSQGRARTKELEGTVKQNLEILPSSSDVANKLLDVIGRQILRNPSIQVNHVPLKIHPPKFSRYADGAHYKAHTDSPWMGETRTDLSCTVWLSDPESYEGGELLLNGKSVKGKPGQCLVYDCGVPHEVTPVTVGARVCAVTWIQSRIREAHKRKIVSDFRKFLSKLEPDHQDWFLEGGSIHSSLIRMWMEN